MNLSLTQFTWLIIEQNIHIKIIAISYLNDTKLIESIENT